MVRTLQICWILLVPVLALGQASHLRSSSAESYDQAIIPLKDELVLAQADNDQARIGKIYWKLAKVAYEHRKYNDSEAYFQQSSTAARLAGDSETLIQANIGSATYLRIGGDHLGGIRLLRECLEVIEKENIDYPELDNLLSIQGGNYRRIGQIDSAILLYQNAVSFAEKEGRIGGLAQARRGLGNTYVELGEYEKAQVELLESLRFYEEIESEVGAMMVMNLIVKVYLEMELWDTALEYAERSLEIVEKRDFVRSKGEVYRNLGVIHDHKGELDEALDYYEKAKALFDRTRNKTMDSNILVRIGRIWLEKGELEKAKGLFSEALAISTRQNEIRNVYDARLALANTMIEGNRFARARQVLDTCLVYFSREEHQLALHRVYLSYSNFFSKQGQFRQALDYHEKYTAAKDKMLNETNSKIVRELETKYETEKQEKEIAQLTAEQELKETALQKQQYFILTLIAGLLAVVGLAIFYYQNWRKNQLITHQNEAINQQRIKELEQSQQLLSLNSMLMGQEKERQRIAQDLHDGLGGLLSSVRSYFGSLEVKIQHHRDREIFGKTHQLLDHAAREVRRIAHNMMPGALTKIGLVGAIEDIAELLESSQKIKVSVQAINMEERLPHEQEISLYRIVQEILNNIVKYAEADKVIIQLSKHENQATLIIEDDGKGFDLEAARSKGGLGLKSIESRVAYLNGELDLFTKPGEGTSYTIQFPLNIPQTETPYRETA